MQVLLYNDINKGKLKKQIETTIAHLEKGEFRAADAKKMSNGFYRAKLDDTNRLLFKFHKSGDIKCILVLEVILNHDYASSRFLNGASIDESKLMGIDKETDVTEDEFSPISFINIKKKEFNILDKVLSFDDTQSEVFKSKLPIIIIGSAGSGKTALTLEKMKSLNGKILYATLSSFLVENAKNIYYALNYSNEDQEVDFLSFNDLLSTIKIPQGKEINFKLFEQWIWKHKQAYKITDDYKVYEEFKGVITGSSIDKAYLSKEDYLNLGIKQSIFSQSERNGIYDLFLKYLDYLKEFNYYDTNIVTYQYHELIAPKYDYVVVDEVQDLTNVQLSLILKSTIAKENNHFIFCGDSNQIVHPNFFSWSQVKTMFYNQDVKGDIIRILATNYRNTPEVTKIANQLLLVKNYRFGSIDRESTYLVQPNSQHQGEVVFYENNQRNLSDINNKTRKSTKYAIIVLRNEDKSQVRKYFNTPLVFSIHEAKGLEYENVILFDLISSNSKEFRDIADGVNKEDINTDEITYSRTKDKSDKSLDEYKFYINSLYVGITRAIKNLYFIESQKKHALLELLGLTNFSDKVNIKEQTSSLEEWQKEAKKLEMQGKQEQADAIKKDVLQLKTIPWIVTDREYLNQLYTEALNPDHFNKKAKDRLYDYALFYQNESIMKKLSSLKYGSADTWKTKGPGQLQRMYAEYQTDNLKQLSPKLNMYGIDYRNELNLTPLMLATIFGSEKIINYLLENGADISAKDNNHKTALQNLITNVYINKKQFLSLLLRLYPTFSKEDIKMKLDNQLVKLNANQGEYFMFLYMLCSTYNKMSTMCIENSPYVGKHNVHFESIDFTNFYEGMSSNIVSKYRTKRTYISSLLAKNEANKEDKYNKKLFVRIRNGKYLINPNIEIEVDGEWLSIYSFLNLKDLKNYHDEHEALDFYLAYIDHIRECLIKNISFDLDYLFYQEELEFVSTFTDWQGIMIEKEFKAVKEKQKKLMEQNEKLRAKSRWWDDMPF